ncbi:hypothetical protein O0I10_009654 [Lichtheimia ornata]|uniref:Uncharacterized protein n=1 Tax=Lichtheimia ornata TaxID=688661 RepID=A0AAD7UVX4_9FUNG|nr:uncharacterized protein O0I10_009654 [Lichtheimia ornata]KAJ8654603.1 hypothetical protein O0I10_009654 [Lichtheimia ornata]
MVYLVAIPCDHHGSEGLLKRAAYLLVLWSLQDHSYELLSESYQPWGSVYVFWWCQPLLRLGWLVTKQRAISLKSVRQCKSLVSGLYQQQTTAFISLVPYQPSSHHPSGAFHYLQFGEPPETKVPYRSIMSATRSRFIPLASASFRSSRGSDYRQFL